MHGHAFSFSFTQQPKHFYLFLLAAHTEVGVQVGLVPLVMCCKYVTEFMSATSIWLFFMFDCSTQRTCAKGKQLKILRHKSLTAPKTLNAPPLPVDAIPRIGSCWRITYTSYIVHQDQDVSLLSYLFLPRKAA